MNRSRGIVWTLALWAISVVLLGALLTSYHQPFRSPGADSKSSASKSSVLALVPAPSHPQWRAIHILSGSCGCSQKVMQHLLRRHPLDGVAEHILVLDDEEIPYLAGSAALLHQLELAGFSVSHLATKNLPANAGLHGVPLLAVASPANTIAYLGGYGANQDRDLEILAQIRSGPAPKPLPILGCAVGSRLRRTIDPFHLKY